MKSVFLVTLLIALISLSCSKGSTTSVALRSDFVSVEDGHFVSEGRPYYYIGANFWYGAILGSTGEGGNRERLAAELDSLQAIGVDNLRVLVGGDGENGLPSRIRPTLQTEPGVYNDTIFDGLDYFMAELGKRNMKAVLYLNNAWEWSGGYSVYLQWAGYGKAPIPSVDGWPTYMEYVAQYMQAPKAKQLFADHVKNVITRTNRYTGKLYTDDPAIMSWQIANEPRCFSDANKEAFVLWIDSVAAQIRSLDPNHLISVGSEGMWGCEQDYDLYETIHSCKNVDYMNIHIWPYNWGWTSEKTLTENLDVAKQNTAQYIEAHKVIAEKYSKPLVLEEFGYPRDGFQFSRESTTTARDSYYGFVFDYVAEEAARNGVLAGCNFWAWGGSAKISDGVVYWELGQPYTGDPAQEQQGLNSIFDTDSTITIIRNANQRLQEIVK